MTETNVPEAQFFPPRDGGLRAVALPIRRVTLLEDRAQVRRVGKLQVQAGSNRLLIDNVAPVLVDVSLQAECVGSQAKVVDVRVRRAARVRTSHLPADAQALRDEARALVKSFDQLGQKRARSEDRCQTFFDMLQRAVDEVPDDAAWGHVDQQVWHDAFDRIFERLRRVRLEALDSYHEQQDLYDQLSNISLRLEQSSRPDVGFAAWLEIDVVADAAAEIELSVEYVVPNALWRPVHAAELTADAKMKLTSSAAVWQNTGEDWTDVELCFSTARSSLGTEPPLLADDLLEVRRKAEEVKVEQREVAIQRAAAPSGGAPSRITRGVELPGVDDGGEVQNLVAPGRTTIPSDGRPCFVPVFHFEDDAQVALVALPELEEKVFLKATLKNKASQPILAGPVELIRNRGFVGWTKVLFVAPGEELELSFGPDEAIRVSRSESGARTEKWVDNWRIRTSSVVDYLSNLGNEEKTVQVTERIPVSEVEQVKITLIADKTSGEPEVDDDGLCKWKVVLGPYQREQVRLTWSISVAPGVQGIV